MKSVRLRVRDAVADVIQQVADEMSVARQTDPPMIGKDAIVVERPPNPELGDVAFPMFPFAKLLRSAPAQIAASVAAGLAERGLPDGVAGIGAEGPYVNVRYERPAYVRAVLEQIETEAGNFGRGESLSGTRIMVEFSSPNTNKPLHLGHLRNDALGESVSRILAANGGEVRKVNLINDRGIHICQSMLAYQKFGDGKTPETEGMKSDHFVGHYYVKFSEYARQHPEAANEARELLKRWEAGDEEVLDLWRRMNAWAIAGIERTYRSTGISFDEVYYESNTYGRGREEVLKGLEAGHFYKADDGTVWVDLSEIGLDKKVLLRSDGTSIYVTQDIGTAIARHDAWDFKRLIYVVASEQKYHFMVLFHVLRTLGFEWASDLFHLAYGMVNLPEGRMKSREGTVVDADDLLAQLQAMAAEEIRTKDRTDEVGDVEATAARVALAALHYYLLQTTPSRDMIFNPRESLSFTGNTGPYLQYMGARICSMLRKDEGKNSVPVQDIDASALSESDEWEMIKLLGDYPDIVESAAAAYSPALIAGFLYDLAKTFSRYYHDNPIVTHPDIPVRQARIALAKAVLQAFRNAFELICIPFLEVM